MVQGLRQRGWLHRTAVVGAVIAAAGLPLACGGVVMDAPKVTVMVQNDGIVFAGPRDEAALVGGETVLTVKNDGEEPRQIVLAKVDDFEPTPDTLPTELLEAEVIRDDGRILGMTRELPPKEALFAGGGLGYKVASEAFHIHLRPSESYVLFDTLPGGVEQGVFLQLVPGKRS